MITARLRIPLFCMNAVDYISHSIKLAGVGRLLYLRGVRGATAVHGRRDVVAAAGRSGSETQVAVGGGQGAAAGVRRLGAAEGYQDESRTR
jgi:hypothetical protein